MMQTPRVLASSLAVIALTVASAAAQAAPGWTFERLAANPAGFGYEVRYPLAEGPDGLAYGAYLYDAPDYWGAIFRFDAKGHRTSVHTFSANEAYPPASPLVRGDDGLLYGAAVQGPTNQGVLFRITAAGTFEIFREFFVAADKVGFPQQALVADGAGGWYGIGYSSGERTAVEELYHLDATGALSVVETFVGPKLGNYVTSLVRTSSGLIVGATQLGPGQGGHGSLFVYQPGGRAQTVHVFKGGPDDGIGPQPTLAVGADDAVFGTTYSGGRYNQGVAFGISRGGQYAVLHDFSNAAGDAIGGIPGGGLTAGSDGRLYGSTAGGGPVLGGTVFAMSSRGVMTRLHAFNQGGRNNASAAQVPPAPFSDDGLWGLTGYGGDFGGGILYKISPAQ